MSIASLESLKYIHHLFIFELLFCAWGPSLLPPACAINKFSSSKRLLSSVAVFSRADT